MEDSRKGKDNGQSYVGGTRVEWVLKNPLLPQVFRTVSSVVLWLKKKKKKTCCQAGDTGLIPESGGFPAEGNDDSSILAWKCHEQRSVAGYSPWGCKRDRHHLATKQQHNSLQFVFHRKFRISWQTEVSYHWNLLLQDFLLWSRHDKLALRETSYVGMKHILDLTHKAHTLEALPYHKH